MNKTSILLISGLLSIGLVIWNYLGNYYICDILFYNGSVGSCPFILTSLGLNLLPIIPFFLFSLITYKMREEVYVAWFRFARVWIPGSMILIFLAPQYSSDWMYSIEKGPIAFLSSLLFFVISFILVSWKRLSTRN